MFPRSRRRWFSLRDFCPLMLIVIAAASSAGAQPPQERMLASRAGIQVSVATRVDSTGAEMPLVRVAVPYRSLVFTRQDGGFGAGARVTAIAKRDGRQVGGGVGEATTTVADYAATRSEQTLSCAVPLRLRGEGPLLLEVEVVVLGTSRRWQERLTYNLGQGLRVPLYFADFAWNVAGAAEVGATLGPEQDSLSVTVQLGRRPNVPAWPPDGVALLAAVAPPGKQDALEPRRFTLSPVAVGMTPRPARIAWSADALPLGRLVLSLWLECGEAAAPERLDLDPPRPFVNLAVRWREDALWRQHVAWLEGTATSEARQELLRQSTESRREAWRAFWAAAAAASGGEASDLERTHLLRIIEADERFGGLGRGALTDRGRLWIRYGEPDAVEEHGDDMSYEGHWEIWYYHEERLVFTFYDAHGLGDFRLVASGTL